MGAQYAATASHRKTAVLLVAPPWAQLVIQTVANEAMK
jgi:hypothetical protein